MSEREKQDWAFMAHKERIHYLMELNGEGQVQLARMFYSHEKELKEMEVQIAKLFKLVSTGTEP